MKKLHVLTLAGAMCVAALAGPALAGNDGITKAITPIAKDHPLTELWSGYKWATQPTREMQDDDFANPAGPWYEIGEANWSKVEGSKGKSCAECHKDGAAKAMKGVSTHYPLVDKASGKLMGIEARINNCRTKYMGAKAWKWDKKDLLGMTIFVKAQSKGMPINVKVDGAAKPFFEAGKKHYYMRRGQLDMSCAHCHEGNYGNVIRADVLSQGQSNGFPTYRLKWQKPGSIHRRFKGCNKQVRAKPYKQGTDEYTNLELYVAWRGQGLLTETPAVRK